LTDNERPTVNSKPENKLALQCLKITANDNFEKDSKNGIHKMIGLPSIQHFILCKKYLK
jgi:hypothetical protein